LWKKFRPRRNSAIANAPPKIPEAGDAWQTSAGLWTILRATLYYDYLNNMNQEKHTPILSLADSLRPLQQHFNKNSDRLRFLALLSPT
jgi:hypothetical protein